MKNKVLLMVLVIMGLVTFSAAAVNSDGLWIGPTAMYQYFVDDPSDIDFESENFAFGVDARLRLGLLEGNILGVYVPSDGYDAVLGFANIGINTNFAMVNVAATAGVSFVYFSDYDETVDAGVNVRLSADAIFGNISVGAYYLMWMDDFEEASIENSNGLVGFSLLFRM